MTVTESRIKTRHEFIADLAAQSSAIAAMALNKRITEAPPGFRCVQFGELRSASSTHCPCRRGAYLKRIFVD
ncbi:MAG: hypothetical protein CR217_10415 [Beijerinckiaceae bacterium]|nr:MAG: hypothetical protein CR217_10415 [Beijerinckiaceae bacterium]